MKRENIIVDSSATLREVLEEAGIDYTMGNTSLDGATLKAGDLDKSFDDFGIVDRTFLLNVVKTDNA